MNEKNLFDNIELNTAENTDVSIKDVIMDDTPQITSLEWNDYVMSLFEEDELIENRPLSAGLRRVSELVLGRIVSSGPVQVFPPKEDNGIGRATVVWKVEFEDGTMLVRMKSSL